MEQRWYLIFAVALVESFLLSVVLTALFRRLAIRWDLVDRPGERTMHTKPIPTLGGVAIYATFHIVIVGNLLLLEPVREFGFEWLEANVLQFLGDHALRRLMGIFAGAFLIFLLGVVDDVRALSPEIKLTGQIVAALVLVLSGIRLDLFIGNVIEAVPFLASMPEEWLRVVNLGVSGGATVLWVVLMTNAMNLLDNMDGLSAGVSVIAALSFFFCVLPREEYFTCAMLMVFAGSVAGFLYHNLNPARIFMGDAGAMFCGFILATVAVLGTFYTAEGGTRVAVAAPLLALCVPIFDTMSVVYIRWRRGESIMKGDKRHFSHRLIEAGMTPRQAVEFIFLVAAVAGLGGSLLSQVDRLGTFVILAQAAGLFLLIILLMKAGRNSGKEAQ